jgi:hypothetical protein
MFGMMFQAWAPLVRAMRFDHPVVLRIAKAVGILGRPEAAIHLKLYNF